VFHPDIERIYKTPLLDRRGGMNEEAPKVHTNECRGGGIKKLFRIDFISFL
jgi:hypothetical protein